MKTNKIDEFNKWKESQVVVHHTIMPHEWWPRTCKSIHKMIEVEGLQIESHLHLLSKVDWLTKTIEKREEKEKNAQPKNRTWVFRSQTRHEIFAIFASHSLSNLI